MSARRLVLCERPFWAGTPGLAPLLKAPCHARARWNVFVGPFDSPLFPVDPVAVVCGTHRRTLIRAVAYGKAALAREVFATRLEGDSMVKISRIPGA